jgi:FixJ family two-component response regulator
VISCLIEQLSITADLFALCQAADCCAPIVINLNEAVHFIQKPISRADLAAKIREMLQGQGI